MEDKNNLDIDLIELKHILDNFEGEPLKLKLKTFFQQYNDKLKLLNIDYTYLADLIYINKTQENGR